MVKLFGSKIVKIGKAIELQPGYINYQTPTLQIGTGTQPIYINSIQIEGKKRLQASQFILGSPEIIGGRFD